jgi:hypothetical protein
MGATLETRAETARTRISLILLNASHTSVVHMSSWPYFVSLFDVSEVSTNHRSEIASENLGSITAPLAWSTPAEMNRAALPQVS